VRLSTHKSCNLCNTDQSKIYPQRAVVTIGGQVDVECESQGETIWTHTTYLSKITSYKETTQSFIHVEGTRQNEGFYDCEGKDKNSNTFVARAHIEVEGTCAM